MSKPLKNAFHYIILDKLYSHYLSCIYILYSIIHNFLFKLISATVNIAIKSFWLYLHIDLHKMAKQIVIILNLD